MRVALALCALAASFLGGGKIDWSKLTVEQGLAEAKKTGRPLIVYFTADW